MQTHPCANCARQIIARSSLKVYCSDLCSQVASFIRYFRGANADGRLWLPDVREALGIKLAHIAAGGYSESDRRLSDEQRAAVIERDGGICQVCGEPASDIDHIRGASADASNLQLLCRACHNSKTQQSMVRAAPEMTAAVHDPIQKRARESPPRQPCDESNWDPGLWRGGAKAASDEQRSGWSSWITRAGSAPLTPALAVAGFPLELSAWSWFLGERPEKTLEKDDDSWIGDWPTGGIPVTFTIASPMDSESATKAREAIEQRARYMAEWAERDARAAARLVETARSFRAPTTGRGKWHTSYADVENSLVPAWVTDPARAPACGSRTVEIDPTSRAEMTSVGELRSSYTDRLCGNCVRIP